jgi:plasmid stability protein
MEAKRSTVYIDAELHQALRMRSAETDCSISHLINEALRAQLCEDAEDLAEFKARAKEKTIDFESFVANLRKNGKL